MKPYKIDPTSSAVYLRIEALAALFGVPVAEVRNHVGAHNRTVLGPIDDMAFLVGSPDTEIRGESQSVPLPADWLDAMDRRIEQACQQIGTRSLPDVLDHLTTQGDY